MILCDSHVHFYACFDIDKFLDSAWNNFYLQARLLQDHSDFAAVLMLTEANRNHWFQELKDNRHKSANWSFRDTEESESLLAQTNNGQRLIIINGRQIVTSENLEVLALATSSKIRDGKPISDVIEWAKSVQSIPIVPWGFGKWWGVRGDILSGVLDSFSENEVFLGDNSGRPWFLGLPRHFKEANRERRRILPGSDPLPFSSESWRPGSVGFYFKGGLDSACPAARLRDYIKDPETVITNYMHCEKLIPFIKNQVAMQIRKRV